MHRGYYAHLQVRRYDAVMKRTLSFASVISALAMASVAAAWTGPTGTPPNNNVAAPINVGTVNQVKNGNIGVNGLAVFGNSILSANAYLNWGTTAGAAGYGIRDHAGVLEFKNSGGTWASLQSLLYGGTQWTTGSGFIYYNGGNVGIGTASPGKQLDVIGDVRAAGEIISTLGSGDGQVRMVAGNYGAILRNDGANTNFLLTASGDQYGTWNAFRPLSINNSTGEVTIGENGMTVPGVADFSGGIAYFGSNATARVSAFTTAGEGGTINLRGANGTNMFLEGLNGTFRLVNNGWAAQIFSVDQRGNVVATGTVTALGYFHSSDARLKDNIETSSGLSVVEKLRGVTFDWKKDGSPSAGVIAQEVEQVMPSAVHTDASGMKFVEYDQLMAPLIEAIKQQQQQIDDLKKEVSALKVAQKK